MSITEYNCHDFLRKYLIDDCFPVVVDLEKSHGSFLVDKKTGKEYLDCLGYYASCSVGHNHPKLQDPEFEKKLLLAAKHKPACTDFWTLEMAEFVEIFLEVAVPPEFTKLFFIEGGTLAVDNAIKAAIDWKYNDEGLLEYPTKIIHFSRAFHGRTAYAMSVTSDDYRKIEGFPVFSWPRLDLPYSSIYNQSYEELIKKEYKFFTYLEDVLQREGNKIAAIITEPIQAAGGDNYYSERVHQFLRKMCDKFNILLIYDEVQTGIGITGKMWAYQHYGVIPDIVCFGKKMQVCGIMCTDKLLRPKTNVFTNLSRIDSTWGGNLTDMVRVGKHLQIIEEEGLVKAAEEVGHSLLTKLKRLEQSAGGGIIRNARGKGLMVAFDVITRSLPRGELIEGLFKHRVLVSPCGTNSIRLRPPLTFSKEEVCRFIDILETVIQKLRS